MGLKFPGIYINGVLNSSGTPINMNSSSSSGGSGISGTSGVGIKSIEWTNDYKLRITCTDGTVYTSPVLKGDKGDDGTSSGSVAWRKSEVTLLSENWVYDSEYYSQVVNIEGVTQYSQIDLTPNADQLAIFHDKDLSFVTENDNGVVTIYAIGDKPLNDYTIQVTIKEVTV